MSSTDGPIRYAVLLRGINVGRGDRIVMTDLRACTEQAGCREVRTVLASGNVVATDPRPSAELRAALQEAYSERFGYSAIVQVVPVDTLRSADQAYPFDTLDQHHDYLVFCDDPVLLPELVVRMTDAVDACGTEAVAAGEGCVYWRCPTGSTLASNVGKITDSSSFRTHLTTRNRKTLHKILAVT